MVAKTPPKVSKKGRKDKVRPAVQLRLFDPAKFDKPKQ